MKKLFVILIMALAAAVAWEASVIGRPPPSHMDIFRQPEGCLGCHRGRGVPGTPLLRERLTKICFRCHGSESKGKGKARTDIESEFAKVSIHPVFETTKYHSLFEDLPEEDETMPRHVSCYDCHIVHRSDVERSWRGVRGYIAPGGRVFRGTVKGGPPPGLKIREASYEYELCYLCHSDSANLANDKNISVSFDPTNPSFHPVEMEGKNKYVPSLVTGLNVASRISCGNCHGNNESNGPRGPHGSDYSPLLMAQYRTENGDSGPKAYELCYMCHDSRSIWKNVSFRYHSKHIADNYTSCYSCHASHGSTENEHLIKFNNLVVTINTTELYYYVPDKRGDGDPRCYLTCHVDVGAENKIVEHNTMGVQRKDKAAPVKPW
jgi:predicted CXXCH cytochrome family protein